MSSVPDAPRPVMGYQLSSVGLHLLDQIVEEEVYQNGIDVRVGVLAQDLSPDELHAPDAARYVSRGVSLGREHKRRGVLDAPLSCISQLPPVSSSFPRRTAASSGGL